MKRLPSYYITFCFIFHLLCDFYQNRYFVTLKKMSTPSKEGISSKETQVHLWHHQSRNQNCTSSHLIDTTTCFETMFNSRSSTPNNERFMMCPRKKPSDTHSFLIRDQNTSEDNVLGSKYLLVPQGSGQPINTGFPGTQTNTRMLHHQKSLPNHHVGYHRGSVAERSSSIITENSGASETPPMTGGM